MIAIARKTIVSPILKNSAASNDLYTIRDKDRATPIATSPPIAITVGLPPNRYDAVVAPAVPQPGQMFGTTANAQNSTPHGFHARAKPAIAVSPVASV